MDKMREEFDAWYSQFDNQSAIQRRAAWSAWKASRAALFVELPDESSVWWHQGVCESLKDAGVSYK